MARLYLLKRNTADELPLTPDSDPSTTVTFQGVLNKEESLRINDIKETNTINDEHFNLSMMQSIITEFRDHPDRLLSNQNLQLILESLGEPTDSNTIQEWMRFYDQNNKGGIELAGFLQIVLDQILPIEDSEEEIDDAFKVFDTDDSGEINCDALEYILKTRGNCLSTEEFGILMSKNNPKKEKSFKWKEFCQRFAKEVYPTNASNALS
ncbi:uncharacterized protein LOC100215550 [Hydra vulgaris]|uniref:Uncharacterized protein LOC100215550 n=1 Tax=Hydra vulgaris TaxID=6087 RepID=A0ABM4CT71_HYDVU